MGSATQGFSGWASGVFAALSQVNPEKLRAMVQADCGEDWDDHRLARELTTTVEQFLGGESLDNVHETLRSHSGMYDGGGEPRKFDGDGDVEMTGMDNEDANT